MTALSRPSIIPPPAMIAEAIPRRWYVLSVEPNRDPHAMRYLKRRQFDVRCLKIEVRKSRRSPDRVVQLMFPGYLFIEMADDDKRWHEVIGKEATKHNHVHCALGSMLAPMPLPVNAVKDLFAMAKTFDDKGYGTVMMAHDAPTLPEDTPIRVVADGAFTGLKGRFKSRLAHNRIAALLTLFNRELPVEMDEGDIAIDDDAA